VRPAYFPVLYQIKSVIAKNHFSYAGARSKSEEVKPRRQHGEAASIWFENWWVVGPGLKLGISDPKV